MFGSYNEEIERQLQDDGYVPAGVDCLWVGDEFAWDRNRYDDPGRQEPQLLRVVDLRVQNGDYVDDNDVFTQHLIFNIIAWNAKEMMYRSLTIGRSHTTWVRQCPKNRRDLFDLHADYEAAKDEKVYV